MLLFLSRERASLVVVGHHMKKNISILLILGIILVFQKTNAQNLAQDYLFSITTESYIPLEDDTTLGSGFQDDVLYMGRDLSIDGNTSSLTGPGLPIGFNFLFDGQIFTRWGFSSNGYIKLGNGTFTIKNSLSTAFSSTADSAVQVNLISALHGDIMMTENQGSFRYRTRGNPGQRVLTVEYRSMKHWVPNPTSEEVFNFQIKLYEGSNRIAFAYGSFLKDEVPRNYVVGIKGRNYSNFHLRRINADETSWLNNVRGVNATSTMATNLNLLPIENSVFNFFPREFDNDLSLEKLLEPQSGLLDCPLSSIESVRVRVKNTGLLAQSSATIGYKTSTGQMASQPVTFSPPLTAQQTRDFEISIPVNLGGLNPPVLKTFVFLPGEESDSRNNDTLASTFTIGRPFESTSTSSYDSLLLKGWRNGRGGTFPFPGYSLWSNTTVFSPNAVVLPMSSDTPDVKNEWIYSPGYKIDTLFNYAVKFRAAIVKDLSGLAPISSIGDDTIKLMYSSDCWTNWKTLKVFSSADLTAGTITNTLNNFSAIIPPNEKKYISFAFFGKNNGNTFPEDYRFIFNGFQVVTVPRFDLSADTVRIPGVVSLSCKYSSQETLVLRITNRGFEAVDSTDAAFSINGGLPIRKAFGFSPPLAPGASTLLSFSGNFGADMSTSESRNVVGFVIPRIQNAAQRRNDTARRSYNLIAPLTIPTPVYPTYPALLTARWQRGRGTSVPFGNFSLWNVKTINSENTAGVDFAPASTSLNEWLYSASYTGPSRVNFIFKAGVTQIGSSDAPAGLNQDSIKVMFSLDCGATWRSVKTFSQQDLSSGNLGNSLKEFSFELVNSRGSILVGFAGFRATGAPSTNGFTFHVDSVTLAVPQFPDIASPSALTGISGQPSCPTSNPVPLGVVVRNAGSLPVSSATVGYRINNGPAVTRLINFSPPLPQGGRDTVIFTGSDAPVYNNAGIYRIKGFALISGEDAATAFNDTSEAVQVSLFPNQSVPYAEAFQGSGLLPIGWLSDTLSGRGFRNSIGRGPNGTQALSFRAVQAFPGATLLSRNFGPITAASGFLGIAYRTQEQSGAFFRLRTNDFIDVLVSTDCGNSFTLLGRIDSVNQQVAPGFIPRDFSLAAYNGQNITLKLDVKLTTKAFTSNFLDISRISFGGPTSLQDFVYLNTSGNLFPNPSVIGTDIQFESEFMPISFQVMAMDGRIFSPGFQKISENRFAIQTSGLSPAVYVLKAVFREKTETYKFLIQN